MKRRREKGGYAGLGVVENGVQGFFVAIAIIECFGVVRVDG